MIKDLLCLLTLKKKIPTRSSSRLKCYGELAPLSTSFISLLVLLASALASVKPAWLNFDQHRGPTYSYNNGSEKRRNWWARFTISIANNNHNTKGHHVIKTKDRNKNWLVKKKIDKNKSVCVYINSLLAANSQQGFCWKTILFVLKLSVFVLVKNS